MSVDTSCSSQWMQVRIFNISAKTLKISPKSTLCELQEVKILRNLDLKKPEEDSTASVNSQLAEERKREPSLPEGVNLDRTKLTSEQKANATKILSKWNSIFSKGTTDLGRTKLVEHEIKLSDNHLFQEPHRRIPSVITEEVREHLQEMLKAETIRESSSPYSSNVVIVRKKSMEQLDSV